MSVLHSAFYESVDGMSYLGIDVLVGDGYWPCLVSIDADINSSVTEEDAEQMGLLLQEAASACRKANQEMFGEKPDRSRSDDGGEKT